MGTAALIRNALTAAANDRKKRKEAKDGSELDRNLKHEALGLFQHHCHRVHPNSSKSLMQTASSCALSVMIG